MSASDSEDVWELVEKELGAMITHQEERVLALGRRLKAGVTAEDLRNPQDFRELDDPDFHYEDGMLAGVKQALMALRARRRERASLQTSHEEQQP